MIYLVLALGYILMSISFIVRNKFIGMISGFLIMTTGVYILINGISYLDTLLIEALATISIGFGFYMLMQASFDIMEESGI